MEIIKKDIRLFQKAIREYSQYDFNDYSMSSLQRRLLKILLEYDLDIESLVGRLQKDSHFLEEVIGKITVHTTDLFRDPQVWLALKEELVNLSVIRERIKIWHPGCSTGQELYSMMILLDHLGLLDRSDLYGSDLSENALIKAREGSYNYQFNTSYITNYNKVIHNDLEENEAGRRRTWTRYFKVDEIKNRITMEDILRSKPLYRKLDLVKDENLFYVNFDLIMCRNVIIYFTYNLQNRVLDLFHKNLASNGLLVLGAHESILGPLAYRFKKKNSVYLKK